MRKRCPIQSRDRDHFTIKLALGTNPSSFRVSPKNSLLNTFLGKFCVKLSTSIPLSWFNAAATSNSVVSTGNVFITLPFVVCRRSLDSVYAEAGLEATGPDVVGRGSAARGGGGARPSRSAFSFSARSLLSSLSASILARMRFLASTSCCISSFFCAACFNCSFFLRSSLASWLSLVFFLRISYRF